MRTYHFQPVDLGYTAIPAFTIAENDFLRIEVDFQLNLQRDQIVRAMLRNGRKVGFMPVAPLQQPPLVKRLFKPWSVETYFRQCGLSEAEIEAFFHKVTECNESIGRKQPLTHLHDVQKKAVFLQSALYRQKAILIDTAGMYLNILYLTYLLIKEFRASGGPCLEIAYPPFMGEDEMKHLVEPNPRTIRLMRKKA